MCWDAAMGVKGRRHIDAQPVGVPRKTARCGQRTGWARARRGEPRCATCLVRVGEPASRGRAHAFMCAVGLAADRYPPPLERPLSPRLPSTPLLTAATLNFATTTVQRGLVARGVQGVRRQGRHDHDRGPRRDQPRPGARGAARGCCARPWCSARARRHPLVWPGGAVSQCGCDSPTRCVRAHKGNMACDFTPSLDTSTQPSSAARGPRHFNPSPPTHTLTHAHTRSALRPRATALPSWATACTLAQSAGWTPTAAPCPRPAWSTSPGGWLSDTTRAAGSHSMHACDRGMHGWASKGVAAHTARSQPSQPPRQQPHTRHRTISLPTTNQHAWRPARPLSVPSPISQREMCGRHLHQHGHRRHRAGEVCGRPRLRR